MSGIRRGRINSAEQRASEVYGLKIVLLVILVRVSFRNIEI